MESLNLKHVIKMVVTDKVISPYYIVLKDRFTKKKWYCKRKPIKNGVYYQSDSYFDVLDFLCTIELFKNTELSNSYQIIDDVMYIKPKLKLYTSNVEYSTLYFNTLQECIDRETEIRTIVGKWINI